MMRLVLTLGVGVFSALALSSRMGALAQTGDGQTSALPPVIVKQESSKPRKRRRPQKAARPKAKAKRTPSPSTPREAAEDSGAVAFSPSLRATPLSQLGSSVSVITAKDLEQKQIRTVPGALSGAPG